MGCGETMLAASTPIRLNGSVVLSDRKGNTKGSLLILFEAKVTSNYASKYNKRSGSRVFKKQTYFFADIIPNANHTKLPNESMWLQQDSSPTLRS